VSTPNPPAIRPASGPAALDALQTILRKLSAERDPQRLCKQAVDEAAAFFGVSECVVLLYDAASGIYRAQRPGVGADADNAGPLCLSSIPAIDIETLANQVAVAIQNARLYEMAQERAHQLTAAYEELRALDRMKDEFVQTVSHELRTPLTYVKGYVELLLEGTLGDLNAEQMNALGIVTRSTESVVRLVNDIISLTRAVSIELVLQPLDLGQIALGAVEAARAVTDEAGIELKLETPEGLPPITGDLQRLGQVFDNLIGNAIKFSPNGGKIWVRLQAEDASVRAEVIDQGIGMAMDQLDRVWERFYQVDGTTTRRFGGTGLGLAIVKRLVEAHHGQVGVSSEPGLGSTFYFTIPRADV
jgi:signal transduction histidine kinase